MENQRLLGMKYYEKFEKKRIYATTPSHNVTSQQQTARCFIEIVCDRPTQCNLDVFVLFSDFVTSYSEKVNIVLAFL